MSGTHALKFKIGFSSANVLEQYFFISEKLMLTKHEYLGFQSEIHDEIIKP